MIFKQRIKAVFILAALLASIFGTSGTSSAQTSPATLSAEEKAQLQRQLDDLQKQIDQYQRELSQVQGQKNTLQNKINQLKKQQSALSLQIQATALQITDINERMAETQASLVDNANRIAEYKKQIAGLIKLSYEQEDASLLYLLLAHDNLSDVLTEMENYSQISKSLQALVEQNREANEKLAQEKTVLEDQEQDARDLLSIQHLQKQQVAGLVLEQNEILNQTKGEEANYQAILSDKRRQANAIQNRLYDLLGVSRQITFGEAVEIAKWASAQTGVRAAFLLSILTQESNLGKNVGTCNRPGDPPEKSYKVIMKPTRDIEPFLQITAALGMDPEITPVSCPMRDSKGNQVGWGGAMGPAQFIPSTWVGYGPKVSAITGKTANPWDIRDAFLASALKLKAGGAGSVEGEWAAAMRYFSGGTNTKYRFYGDSVVARANKYQQDIEALN